MVSIISSGHSIKRIFNYNEIKVKEGVAECIGAENYPVDADQMSLDLKLNRLLKQAALNENTQRNSVHISLNFDNSESDFSKEKLVAIATAYMENIGFGNQPYLIYQHYDAAHPHIHLVTTNIQSDGKRIKLHRLANLKSEPTRKKIEEQFGLVKAESHKTQAVYKLEPISAAKVLYGKLQTKRALQNVLEHVYEQYRFTSLAEYNAVLKLYNVFADKGTVGSRVSEHKGLLYHVLDSYGQPIGVPIKASLFYNRPTLANLEKKFSANEAKRLPYRARVKNTIDLLLRRNTGSLDNFSKELQKHGIALVLRQNDEDMIYGMTYVDHQTKCVFNGSDLGKPYSAKAVLERLNAPNAPGQNLHAHSHRAEGSSPLPPAGATEIRGAEKENHPASSSSGTGLLEDLLQPEQTYDYVPGALKRKRRRKKKKNHSR